MGLADSLDLIAGQGIRQRRAPDAVLSRVIAANSSMCVLAQMVGYGISGGLLPLAGPQGVYVLCGAVVAVSAIICIRRSLGRDHVTALRPPSAGDLQCGGGVEG